MKTSNKCTVSIKTSPIGGFVEKQHELKSTALSGKTTEGLASPSDYHKTAGIMSDEDVLFDNLLSLLHVNL
jgi:hypothetical protein